jgi:hypothetical protein
MTYKSANGKNTPVGLLDRAFTRISYTVSPSYLLEAELDREWEQQARNSQELFSGTGVDKLTTEEGRA